VTNRARPKGTVAAVDLGASSGRVVLGHVGPGFLSLSEVHRFANQPLSLRDGLHWDAAALFRQIQDGLRSAGRQHDDIISVGIDTWAVDYGLLDAEGRLIANPWHYRDGRTAVGVEAVRERLHPAALYARTGLQFLPFNTIYQLASSLRSGELERAETMLLMPDLFGYWLSGELAAEATNASTTGLFDISSKTWASDIAGALGIQDRILPPIRWPGERIAALSESVRSGTGLGPDTQLTLVGSHDTASAVVGVPARGDEVAYISCGTWALVGLELPAPVLSEPSRAANFTNELGVDSRIRYLRNVAGLWLLQESVRTWEQDDRDRVDLDSLLAAASELPPGGPTVDPNDPTFLPPGDMPARIVEACRKTDGRAPASRPAIVRCIVDSLAAAFARTLADAVRLSSRAVDTVHLVGGGSRNRLLCQLTADACQLPVVAGPVEATAIGNILVQARAHGLAQGDLASLRALVRETQPLTSYQPEPSRG
jgi:rhamnulokinase